MGRRNKERKGFDARLFHEAVHQVFLSFLQTSKLSETRLDSRE